MRSVAYLCVATITFGLSMTTGSLAASVTYPTSTTRVMSTSQATPARQATPRSYSPSPQSDVPANCIRQECGKLWCWQMK